MISDSQQIIVGIDTDQIPDQVVTRIGAGDRKTCEDISRNTFEIPGQYLTDIFTKYIQRRPAIYLDDDITFRFCYLMAIANGATALCQASCNGNITGKYRAGQTACRDRVGNLKLLT